MADTKVTQVAIPSTAPPTLPSRLAVWPTELQAADDIIGLGSLNADQRATLAMTETPFCVVGAEQRLFPARGKMEESWVVIFDLIVAPDQDHDQPWKAQAMLGMPKTEDAQSDRTRLLEYFDGGNTRPVGPCIFVMVPTSQPQPYCAIRRAPDAVMARFAMQLGQ